MCTITVHKTCAQRGIMSGAVIGCYKSKLIALMKEDLAAIASALHYD